MTTFFNRNRAQAGVTWWQPEFEECVCKRQAKQPHCHSCGSAFVYSLIRETKTITYPPAKPGEQPQQVSVRGFRCRHCGFIFNEDDPCNAPVKVKSISKIEMKANQRALRDSMKAGKVEKPVTGEAQLKLLLHLKNQFPDNPNIQRMLEERNAADLRMVSDEPRVSGSAAGEYHDDLFDQK